MLTDSATPCTVPPGAGAARPAGLDVCDGAPPAGREGGPAGRAGEAASKVTPRGRLSALHRVSESTVLLVVFRGIANFVFSWSSLSHEIRKTFHLHQED